VKERTNEGRRLTDAGHKEYCKGSSYVCDLGKTYKEEGHKRHFQNARGVGGWIVRGNGKISEVDSANLVKTNPGGGEKKF